MGGRDTSTTTIVVDKELWDEFKERVKERGISASFVIRELIRQYIEGDIDISVSIAKSRDK